MSTPVSRIFVSHSHHDNSFGFRLVADLRRALGGDETAVWYDVRGGLHGGDAWWRKIIEEITARPVFLVVLSPEAMASTWVNDEIDLAWQQKNAPDGKVIIPLLLRPCDIRADLRTRQIVSFAGPRPYEEALDELLETLDKAAGNSVGHNVTSKDEVTTPGATSLEDHAAVLMRQMTMEIESATRAGDWQAVADKVAYLSRNAPGALTPVIYRSQGKALQTLGRLDEANTAFDAALALDPKDISTLRASARVRLDLGHVAEAALLLQDALALTADSEQRLAILVEYVLILRAGHDYVEALRRTDEALRLAPEDLGWLERRLDLLRLLQRDSEVLDLLRTITRRPDATLAHWLALAEATPDRPERRKAVAAAAQMDPNNLTVRAVRDGLLVIIPVERFPKGLADLDFEPHDEGGVEHIIPPLCTVPSGRFQMGNGSRSNQKAGVRFAPQHEVWLSAFQIGRFSVTVAEYACATRAGAVGEPSENAWRSVAWKKQLMTPDHPVVCVSWHEAMTYAAWLAQITGRRWYLPSEAEWEMAARGTSGRVYPWGNKWNETLANTVDSGLDSTTSVGTFVDKGDASPYGAHDMAGNVWEWTTSLDKSYPYNANDGRENPSAEGNRILRGGSWHYGPLSARTFECYSLRPDYRTGDFGFRLACLPTGTK